MRVAFARRTGPRILCAAFIAALGLSAAAPAWAEEEQTFRIEFNDGQVTPQRLEVPAGKRIVLDLHNLGKSPAEFESRELRKEKVLAPESNSTLVIRGLEPGTYDFFDDFHPEAPPAVLVAK